MRPLLILRQPLFFFGGGGGDDVLQSCFLMNHCPERWSGKAIKAEFGSKLPQHNEL